MNNTSYYTMAILIFENKPNVKTFYVITHLHFQYPLVPPILSKVTIFFNSLIIRLILLELLFIFSAIFITIILGLSFIIVKTNFSSSDKIISFLFMTFPTT